MCPVTYCLAVAQRSCLCGPAHVSMTCGPASNRPLRPIGTDVRIYYQPPTKAREKPTPATLRRVEKPKQKKIKKRKKKKKEGNKERQKWLSEVCWCGVPHRRLTAAAP